MRPYSHRTRHRETTASGAKGTIVRCGRLRRSGATLALLLAISPVAAGCTPAEIEGSMQRISVSFEQGGAERGLAEAIFVLNNAIPIIDMRLRSAFAP